MSLRLLLTAAILFATACATGARPAPSAGAPGPAGPAAPPAMPGPGGEVVRLGPSALRYVVHQQIHVEQQFQGQTQTIDRGVRMFVAATIAGSADTLGYPVTFTIDSIVADSGSPLPATLSLSAARGLKYTGRVSPVGDFHEGPSPDSARAQAFAQLIGAFRSFYPRLPPGGVTLAAEWTDSVTSTDRAGVEVTMKSVNRSRAPAWEARNDTRCLRLETSATYTVAGAGEQGGQPLEVTGSGTRSAVQFLAVDGRYLGGEVHDSSMVMVNLPIQGVTVPVRQVSHSIVTVLR
jgi:hypothetical protein